MGGLQLYLIFISVQVMTQNLYSLRTETDRDMGTSEMMRECWNLQTGLRSSDTSLMGIFCK